jgi:hypothetical protein
LINSLTLKLLEKEMPGRKISKLFLRPREEQVVSESVRHKQHLSEVCLLFTPSLDLAAYLARFFFAGCR